MTLLSIDEWDRWLEARPEAHLLQTAAWGQLKEAFGWQAQRVTEGDAGAQVLFRRLPLGYSLAYIPMGPVGSDWTRLLPALDELSRSRRAILLKIEPDPLGPEHDLEALGFIPSPHAIQPPRTIVINLAGFPDAALARMKQKTRYNIRLARKKGVTVQASTDVSAFNFLMQATGQRDQFGVHTPAYYQEAFDLFYPLGLCRLFMAYVESRPVAGLMAFARGRRAWYLYGASADEERRRMPNYLVQWEAMCWASERGCLTYDLYGVPDHDEETLEAEFENRSDGLWGVYRFKRGFGGTLVRAPGAFDRAYSPVLYRIYKWYATRMSSETRR